MNSFDGFKGKPKIIVSKKYDLVLHKEKQIEELTSFDSVNYDKKGRVDKHLEFHADGKLYGEWSHTYDKFGNLLGMDILFADKPSSIRTTKKVNYNRYGQIVKMYHKNHISEITYYRDKRETIQTRKKKTGELMDRAIIRYNKHWKQIELLQYDESNKLKTVVKNKYDQNGNKIESQWLNSANEMYNLYTFEYNNQNDKVLTKSYKVSTKDTILEKTTAQNYIYDNKMNAVRITTSVNGKIKYIETNKITY